MIRQGEWFIQSTSIYICIRVCTVHVHVHVHVHVRIVIQSKLPSNCYTLFAVYVHLKVFVCDGCFDLK